RAGTFRVIYLVRNTITNLTTEAAQAECFRTVAAQLEPGGAFVIENYVPHLHDLPPGETMFEFDRTPTHVGVEEYGFDDQIAISHPPGTIDGNAITRPGAHRYVWPEQLDAMAEAAGLVLAERWSDWERSPFTASSVSHVSVWRAETVTRRR